MLFYSYKVNELFEIKEFYTFFDEVFVKGFHFVGESHNFWECMYIEEGSICITADDRVYNLGKNEMIFHKPMEYHKFYVTSDTPVKATIFSFCFEGKYIDYFKDGVFFITDEQKKILDSLLGYVRKFSRNLQNDDENFAMQYLLPFKTSRTYSHTVITYIHQLFLSLIDNGKLLHRATDPDTELFHKAVDYMNSNIHTQTKVSDIAKSFNVSESTLKRIFDKFTGIGVHRYFVQLKMKTATELLQNGMSVGSVSEKLGFSSPGYFSAAYKRETGINPSEIKKF